MHVNLLETRWDYIQLEKISDLAWMRDGRTAAFIRTRASTNHDKCTLYKLAAHISKTYKWIGNLSLSSITKEFWYCTKCLHSSLGRFWVCQVNWIASRFRKMWGVLILIIVHSRKILFFFPLISVNRHDWPCFSREDCTNLFFVATLSKHTFSWFSTRSGITISGKNTIEGEAVTIDDISARSEIVEIDPAEEKKLLRKVNWKLMPVVSLPTKKTPRRCWSHLSSFALPMHSSTMTRSSLAKRRCSDWGKISSSPMASDIAGCRWYFTLVIWLGHTRCRSLPRNTHCVSFAPSSAFFGLWLLFAHLLPGLMAGFWRIASY